MSGVGVWCIEVGRYTPSSTTRKLVVEALYKAYPEPLSIDALWEYVEVNSGLTVNTTTMYSALRHLKAMGAIERVSRGSYRLSPDYLDMAEVIVSTLKAERRLSNILKHINNNKETGKWQKVAKSGSFLTDKDSLRKIMEYVKKLYGDKIDCVDEAIVEYFAWRALEGDPYIVDRSGEGLASRVLAAIRARAPSSSVYNNSVCVALDILDEALVGDRLKHLHSLGILYVRFRERKARLDRGLIVEALSWASAP